MYFQNVQSVSKRRFLKHLLRNYVDHLHVYGPALKSKTHSKGTWNLQFGRGLSGQHHSVFRSDVQK